MNTPEPVPFVSVIMPVRNEEVFICRSLGAVLAQDYPADWLEVLVVDGRSDDQTVPIVQGMVAHDSRVRLLVNPGRIQARAMNIGLAAARGEVIVRVDGHTVIAPDYVSRCVDHLYQTGATTVGGPLHAIGITEWGRALAAAYRSRFGVSSRYKVSRRAEYVDMVHMGAWRRDVFTQVGLFDEDLTVNEDYEHNYRIRKAGGRVYLSPDIRSDYYGRQSPGGLWQQFFRYGRGKFKMLVKHPASTLPRHLAAPAFVAVAVGGAMLCPFSGMIRRLWQTALFSYALLDGAASVQAAARDDWKLLPRLPFVFICMHTAWGSGFWVEALRLMFSRTPRKESAESTGCCTAAGGGICRVPHKAPPSTLNQE